jgi:hypothetical protein
VRGSADGVGCAGAFVAEVEVSSGRAQSTPLVPGAPAPSSETESAAVALVSADSGRRWLPRMRAVGSAVSASALPTGRRKRVSADVRGMACRPLGGRAKRGSAASP